MTTTVEKQFIQKDALNRAFRSFLQMVVLETALVVIPEVTQSLDGENFDWDRIGVSALRAFLISLLSYLMRLRVSPADTPPPVPAVDGDVPADAPVFDTFDPDKPV